MRTAPTSTSGFRRRTVARLVAVLALLGGAAVLGAAPANALPRACDTIGHQADVYFGYAQAEYAVGDLAAGDRWMRAYYGQIGLLVAFGC